MSGWIKLEKDLLTDPRLLSAAAALAKRYHLCEFQGGIAGLCDVGNDSPLPGITLVLGGLARLWVIADTHIGEDDILALTSDQIDELVGIDGFCEVLPDEWLQVLDGKRVKLPNYHAHNGSIAKERAQNSKRQAEFKTRNAANAFSGNGRSLPDQDQEKTKTKNINPPLPPEGADGLDPVAWNLWQGYRKLKPKSIALAQKKLAAFGAEQLAVVEQSIANGWKGLFELKRAGPTRGAPVKFRTPEEIEAEEAARAQH